MLLTFATADAVYADFGESLMVGTLVLVLTIITTWVASRKPPSIVRTSSIFQIGGIACLILLVVVYNSTYGRFIGAEVGENEARLSFAGSHLHTTILKREQIESVLFGFPGKGEPSSCYLKFITKSGESYRSATTEGKVCKDYQAQIRALMKI
jgi:hypothetical protein